MSFCAEGDLTLRLNGENHITVTDEDSDASYAVNVAGELKVEGDGVLYVSSATEEKVYGTEPGAEADTEENSGNNDTNTNTNTNDIDNTQTVEEAPVNQTVEDGDIEVTTNNSTNDGDVNVSNDNNVVLPDIHNHISLPNTSDTVVLTPN